MLRYLKQLSSNATHNIMILSIDSSISISIYIL